MTKQELLEAIEYFDDDAEIKIVAEDGTDLEISDIDVDSDISVITVYTEKQ